MKIPGNFLNNQSFDAKAIAFNRQMPPGLGMPMHGHPLVPVGAKVLEDGNVAVTLSAPEAAGVSAGHEKTWIELVRGDDGVWTGIVPYTEPGFKQLGFKVDGVQVLNPLAPIGFGSGGPINYIDIPDTACDYLLLRDVPHGSVSLEYYMSSVTGETECCYVYTPPCYQEDLTQDYPVLYLQHGAGENEACWIHQGKTNVIMDNLIADGKAVPFIIVMNNGMVQVKKDGEWTVDTNLLQDLLIEDCIPFIDKKYRVRPGKYNRAVAGLSLGSLQAAKTAMERVDLFGAAGMFSGFAYPKIGGKPAMPQPWLSVFDDAEAFNREIPVFFGAMGSQEPSMTKFEEERALCAEKGIRYIQKDYPGGHEWRVWRAASHDFFQLLFK